MRGNFIVFEGLDGSGKSTAQQLLAEKLGDSESLYLTREPSDGSIGRLIRQALTGQIVLEPKTFTLLFAADRYEHVTQEIIPALERGETVFCDRYYFSNMAYQGDVASAETILSFNQPSRDLITPDIVFFIDTPPEECMRRIRKGRDAEELFEKLDKLRNVEKLYKEAFALLSETEHVEIIDGMLSPEEITEKMMEILGDR